MFAYRHDILKALIADGVKLVVLGREEKPRRPAGIRGRQAIRRSRLARARTRLHAGDEAAGRGRRRTSWRIRKSRCAGDNQVIRVFAKALYHVTANAPRRSRTGSSAAAPCSNTSCACSGSTSASTSGSRSSTRRRIGAGKWKGTAAVHDRVAYWAAGVLAYFDAAGQDAAPSDAPHPIATREALAAIRSRPVRPRPRDDGLRRPRRLAPYSQIETACR